MSADAARPTPRVSVITVVRNACTTITRCVESVLGQSYPNIEYLVVDGASTDGTLETLRGYEAQLSRLVSEPDGGIYEAMNKGIGLSSGDYLMMLNADDWYDAQMVESLVQCITTTGADLVCTDAYLRDPRGRILSTLRHDFDAGLLTSSCQAMHQTMLVPRHIYERLGAYDLSYRVIADFDFIARALCAGLRCTGIRRPLLNFSAGGFSKQQQELRLAERERLLGGLFPFLEPIDLERICTASLSNRERLELIDRYAGQSELFVRSLALNMAKSPGFQLADRFYGAFSSPQRQTLLARVLRSLNQTWIRLKRMRARALGQS